jgi:hypothetical protein
MGNRDKQGREKKKPKKSQDKPVINRPYRPIVDSRPTAPAAPTTPPAPGTENKS